MNSATVVTPTSPRNVAQRHAQKQAGQEAAGGKSDVPHLPPPAHRLFAAEFDGHRAENQRHQQQHQREIKTGEHRRIDVRERGEQRAAAGDQPDFVAVPDRADGVEQRAAFRVILREQMQRADAEVEAVEHGVAGEQHADEDEPDGVQVKIHGVKEKPRIDTNKHESKTCMTSISGIDANFVCAGRNSRLSRLLNPSCPLVFIRGWFNFLSAMRVYRPASSRRHPGRVGFCR
jgi:hypothetical protein